MANLKKFKVDQPFGDNYVELEVDIDVLTPAIASEINSFVSGANDRLDSEDGDVVRVAIRMFGEYAIRYFLHDGGANLYGPIGDENVWATKKVLDYVYEGWPDFESLGIVIFSAIVEVPTFDDLTLEEIDV